MTRLFGTDGVRGVANSDLTPDLALALGRAAGVVLARGGEVVVGRDTRVSGPMLEGALTAGLCSAGASVASAGVLPTPAVAHLTLARGARAGAVISASHNVVEDNGIKFFTESGLKAPAGVEDAIEAAMAAPGDLPVGLDVGGAAPLGGARDNYVRHLLESLDGPLDGLKVVLDCAYGAAWEVGPRALREAGAEVVALHARPDGTRINVDCGSTSLAVAAAAVVAEGAALGLALDGDADRVLAVDETGAPVDGDQLLGIAALRLKARGALDNDAVVTTVMSNLAFRAALEGRGIDVVAAPVGDRFVAEAMMASGAALGGEQSGHLIFGRHATTGDGLLTGLHIARALLEADAPLSRLAAFFEPFPQVLVNVPVTGRERLEVAEELWEKVRVHEEALGEDGRVLVRASGTEPVVRVLVEARAEAAARRIADDLARAVQDALGG